MIRVTLTRGADRHLDEIVEYLQEHSPRAAERFATRFDRSLRLIAANPKIGRLRTEIRPGLRSVVLGKYVMFYRLDDVDVFVVADLHGSRDTAFLADADIN